MVIEIAPPAKPMISMFGADDGDDDVVFIEGTFSAVALLKMLGDNVNADRKQR